MAWLKVYDWEHEKWPEFQGVFIDYYRQLVLARKFSRHFKVLAPRMKTSRSRGLYFRRVEVIKLPKRCPLGLFCHEFAHHLAWKRWNESGHGRKFKREMKRTYTFAKRYLPAPTSPIPLDSSPTTGVLTQEQGLDTAISPTTS